MQRAWQSSSAGLLTVLVSALLVAPSCQTVQGILDAAPKPTIEVAGISFKDIDVQSLTLGFDLRVTNPYSVPLPVLGLDFALASGETTFLVGENTERSTIPAHDAMIVPVTTRINILEMLRVVQGVRPGNVMTVKADLGVSVDAPVVGTLRLPISAEKEVPIPAAPDIALKSVKWTKLSYDQASAELTLGFGNTNDFALDLNELGFDLSLANASIGHTGLDAPESVKAGQSRDLKFKLEFAPINFGIAAFNLLRGTKAGYRLNGGMKMGTPFGPLHVPITQTGTTDLGK